MISGGSRVLSQRGLVLLLCVFVSGAVFGLYMATLAPGVTWGDSAKLAMMSCQGWLSIEAGTHPLRNAIGSVFNILPFGDVAYRQNIMSAFFAALTCCVMFVLIYEVAGSLFGAVCGTCALAVSHVFWHVAVLTESYSLFSFLLAVILWCAARWKKTFARRYLMLGSFVFGLSLMNSVLMFMLIPAFAIFLMLAWRWRDATVLSGRGDAGGTSVSDNGGKKEVCQCVARHNICDAFLVLLFGLLGYMPMLVLFICGLSERDFASQARLLLDLRYAEYLFFYHPLEAVKGVLKYPAYLFYQFPFLGAILGGVGLWRNFKEDRTFFWALFLIVMIVVVFTSTYMIQRRFNVMVCTFDIFAIWIGIGSAAMVKRLSKLAGMVRGAIGGAMLLLLVLIPIVLYWQTPELVRRMNMSPFQARTVPYRDNLQFFLTPWKHGCDGAMRYAEEVFRKVEQGGIVVADFTILAVLDYYQRVKGIRPDVELISTGSAVVMERIGKSVAQRAVYLADDEPAYRIDELKRSYRIVESPPLLRVLPD